ncbi:MAG: hypothetical protein C5S47_07605 [Candidatus Methanogasteraceae archaeon]|nr:MAG: hypothetical protein C5S47_07605 [ANME-2 cluster archaeon]
MLAVLLECAGTTAGGRWVVNGDVGAGADFMRIQAAVNDAIEEDSIEVWGRSYV